MKRIEFIFYAMIFFLNATFDIRIEMSLVQNETFFYVITVTCIKGEQVEILNDGASLKGIRLSRFEIGATSRYKRYILTSPLSDAFILISWKLREHVIAIFSALDCGSCVFVRAGFKGMRRRYQHSINGKKFKII